MMPKLLGKRDVLDSGLTVLELLPMSTMFLRMSEMGKVFILSQPPNPLYKSEAF